MTEPYTNPEGKQSICPNCGYAMECHTSISEPNATPAPGSLSVCLKCGFLSIMEEKLKLRRPTKEEWENIKQSETWPTIKRLLDNFDRLKDHAIRKTGRTVI